MQKYKTSIIFVFFVSVLLFIGGCGDSGQGSENNANSSDNDVSDYPEKPITLVVPYAAGGSASNTAIFPSEYAEEELGEEIVIENKEGGSGATGSTSVANADPDGYTFLLGTPTIASNPVFEDVAYTPDSFDPVAQLTSEPTYLVAYNEEPYNDIESFIEYAEDHPGEVTVGTSGANTSKTITVEKWAEERGLDIKVVPYEGGSEAAADAAGGHIEAQIGNYSETSGQVDDGKLEPILVFDEEGSEQYPDLTTSFDIGDDMSTGTWRGILAPEGTDPEIIEKVNNAYKKALEDDEVKEKMEDAGIPVVYGDQDEFADVIDEEYRLLKEGDEE